MILYIFDMKIVFITIILIINAFNSIAQQTTLIKYFPGIALNEGIYVNFINFKQNAPIPPENILTKVDLNSFYFYELLFQNEKIAFINLSNDTVVLESKNIWGYCNAGIVYIQLNNEFCRIHQVGAMSHFVGKKTVFDNNYIDPALYWQNQGYRPQTSREEMQEYILDFESGALVEFELKSFEALLKRDEELYNEFNALSLKKKNQLKFYYLKKFNDRNPIYFPIN
jgi:hypothetical protein